eukprot:XP_001700307.1 folate/pteridine transporter [Chlamydomonas reinhardtii]
MQHRAHHSHGPQPLAAAAPEREALLSEQEQTERSPPASLLSRLNRLRKKPVVSLFQDLKSVKVMGLDPSPELVAISMVYFVQGILGLSRLAAVAGSLQSLCWASAAVGGITSAYFSGSFVQDYGCRFVFGLTAFFPLVVCASALLIEEKPFGAAPAAPSVSGCTARDVPLRRMLVGVMVLGTALNSSQLVLISGLHRQWGLSDQLFVLGDSMVLGQISWMPILVLAARMCPAGVEATLFATLMSVLNCGSITGSALGAGLTNLYGVTSDKYDNLFALRSVN